MPLLNPRHKLAHVTAFTESSDPCSRPQNMAIVIISGILGMMGGNAAIAATGTTAATAAAAGQATVLASLGGAVVGGVVSRLLDNGHVKQRAGRLARRIRRAPPQELGSDNTLPAQTTSPHPSPLATAPLPVSAWRAGSALGWFSLATGLPTFFALLLLAAAVAAAGGLRRSRRRAKEKVSPDGIPSPAAAPVGVAPPVSAHNSAVVPEGRLVFEGDAAGGRHGSGSVPSISATEKTFGSRSGGGGSGDVEGVGGGGGGGGSGCGSSGGAPPSVAGEKAGGGGGGSPGGSSTPGGGGSGGAAAMAVPAAVQEALSLVAASVAELRAELRTESLARGGAAGKAEDVPAVAALRAELAARDEAVRRLKDEVGRTPTASAGRWVLTAPMPPPRAVGPGGGAARPVAVAGRLG